MALSNQSLALINSFEHAPGVTPQHASALRDVINASPALVAQVNAAVASGQLKSFAPLAAGTHAGGTYDGATGTMNLPLDALTAPAGGQIDAGNLTFVLGHELRHGANNTATKQAYQAFMTQAQAVAKSAAAVHDYSAPVERLLSANRRDEASAEIAGWNALASRLRAEDPNVTLERMYLAQPHRTGDFIAVDQTHGAPQYSLKPGLSVNPDMSMASTPANVEAMGKYYFDKGTASGLGHLGNSSYADHYGTWPVSVAAQYERALAQPFHGAAPKFTLDMNRLHLHEATLEQNGIDLGTNHHPVPYFDSSTHPATPHQFNHTKTSHTYVPVQALDLGLDATARQADPRDPAHPHHGLYGQVRDAVGRLDASHGRAFDETSERVTASMYGVARANGMSSVSDVVAGVDAPGIKAGERLFVVQGGMDNPANRIAWMPTLDAMNTPVAESLRRAENLASPDLAQAQAQVRDVAPPAVQERAPVLTLSR